MRSLAIQVVQPTTIERGSILSRKVYTWCSSANMSLYHAMHYLKVWTFTCFRTGDISFKFFAYGDVHDDLKAGEVVFYNHR